MASGSKMHSDSVVKERRLRPIYELLDISMNRKVVQEVDRLLKKQPNFTCAKVLKALALLRMGKTADCLAILDPIVQDVPTDENTIQALSICYRELDQPHKVCQILEQACKNEKNEDLLSNCFMAYTRVGDFQKQHQTALTLYKNYPKTPYFSWAIMSLYAMAERKSDPLVTRVSLPLAERMMAKFIEENKVETEHELTLYALILRKQQKYEKMLEVLDTTVGKLQLSECAAFYNKYKCECLANLNKHEELANFMESNLRKTSDDYKSYAEYIKTFGETQTERVTEFLAEMRAKDSNRSCLLACLYLYQFLYDRGISSEASIDPISIFKEYAERFGSKPSFYMDLNGFLSGLQKEDAKEAFLAIMKDFIKTPIDFSNANDVQRHVNYQYMSRFFSNRKQHSDPVKILGYVQHHVGLYLDGCEAIEQARKTSTQMDEAAVDEFLTLACLMLADSIWFDMNAWIDVLKVIQDNKKVLVDSAEGTVRPNLLEKYSSRDPAANLHNDLVICRSSDGATEKGDSTTEEPGRKSVESKKGEPGQGDTCSDSDETVLTNGISRLQLDGDQCSISEEDFPILLCLSLLEHAIERSPKNAQLLLLLSKLYIRCGAVGAGADAVIALDVKHMQWESLGYLYIWKLTSSGFNNEAARILKLVEGFYTSYQKESMEFVISAYKYGSWEKIIEFMEFRDLLLNSVQFGLLKVERQLLEYSRNTARTSSVSEIAQASGLGNLNLKADFTDSRDFSVLLTYTEEKVSQEQIQTSFQAELQRLKVRGVIALLLDQLVLSQSEDGISSRAARVEELLDELAQYAQEDYSQFRVSQIPLDGMWPPRIHEYKQYGHLELLLNMIKLTYGLAKDSNTNLSDLMETVRKLSNEVTLEQITSWTSSKHTLLNRAERLERACDFVETFGFCCTLAEVCHSYVTKTSNVNGKTKKKKSKEVSSNSSNQKDFKVLIETLVDNLKKSEAALLSSPLMSEDSFPSYSASSDFWASVVNHDLRTYILPYAFPSVVRKLQLSYERSFLELTKNIDRKIKHLQRISVI